MAIKNETLVQIFKNSYEHIVKKKAPGIKVQFYSYSGIKSTIRKKRGVIYAGVSDTLKEAPITALISIASILIGKLENVKIGEELKKDYYAYTNSMDMQISNKKIRKKIIIGNNGKFHNLTLSFYRVNDKYFQGKIKKPNLSWSANKTFRKFGEFEPRLNVVYVSKALDDIKVPTFVVDYIVFHELLHLKYGAYFDKRERVHHSKIRKEEKRFEQYKEANAWLNRIARQAKN